MVEVLGMVHGLGDLHRYGCVCLWGVKMKVSKERFTKDALMRQEMKRCREKEEYALAIINLENVYESYMHNKRYLHYKKCTKRQFQC